MTRDRCAEAILPLDPRERLAHPGQHVAEYLGGRVDDGVLIARVDHRVTLAREVVDPWPVEAGPRRAPA
ncbi:MAG: hypothetical protein M3O77_04380, partial [Chloroflexota bacterium]|nr:hypothetical protein [Chloroflexota bacterium]